MKYSANRTDNFSLSSSSLHKPGIMQVMYCIANIFQSSSYVFSSDYYWLHLKEEGGNWKWKDGTAYTWSNFDHQPPDTSGNKECAMASITDHTWITAKCYWPQDDAMVLCQIACKNEKNTKKPQKYQGFHEILEMVKDLK